MTPEIEPKTKTFEITVGGRSVQRLKAFAEELRDYIDILKPLYDGIFRTTLKEEIRNQVAHLEETKEIVSVAALHLKGNEPVSIHPLPSPYERDYGIAFEFPVWWTGNIGHSRFESILRVLYPQRNGQEISESPERIREALRSGKKVILKLQSKK